MSKNLQKLITTVSIILLIISSVIIIKLIANALISFLMILFIVVISTIIYRKLSFHTKRIISENIFVIISGLSALILIGFVIFLLLHIFWHAKGSLSLEFFFSDPKEGLTEGGIFPAIIGTALLVILMSIFSVPLGTITAIYLTEYAKSNSRIARSIRFAINTLAGVPSIVFGLFGLGFFIGTVGKQIDKVEFSRKLDKIEGIISVVKEADYINVKKLLDELSRDKEYWKIQIESLTSLSEFKDVVSENELITFIKETARPKWGQPALIWAALTMALLTLPVVIVSVEEAIRAVPQDIREASLALGATKFSTILRVVLPGSISGILTGAILAVSRGAGEVAPILFTGAAYYLPDLPNSINSQFMELGYHIYVLTTQSTNVDQTLPLQFATTFVLLFLTFSLNFSAIFIRSKVRKRMQKLN